MLAKSFRNKIKKLEIHKKTGKYLRRERYAGSCQRSFYVGKDITEEDIKAVSYTHLDVYKRQAVWSQRSKPDED